MGNSSLSEDELARIVFYAGLAVHRKLGPGLLENAYEGCLYYELCKLNLKVERQKALPLIYETIKIETGYRLDLLVEGKIIIELKAVEKILPLHVAQLLTYLKLSGCKIGLLLNFNTELFKNGVKRVINGQL
jgi:GxxExxY protein